MHTIANSRTTAVRANKEAQHLSCSNCMMHVSVAINTTTTSVTSSDSHVCNVSGRSMLCTVALHSVTAYAHRIINQWRRR